MPTEKQIVAALETLARVGGSDQGTWHDRKIILERCIERLSSEEYAGLGEVLSWLTPEQEGD